MTDQPPPPTEKKPRRRGPPRKRKPAVAKTVQSAPADGPLEAAAAAVEAQALPATAEEAQAVAPMPQTAEQHAEVAEPATAPKAAPETPPTPGRAKRPDRSPRPPKPQPPHRSEERAGTREDKPRAVAARDGGASHVPTAEPRNLVRIPLSVRWRDLDAFNHVNNSKYLSFLEEARLRWMLGMPGMGLDDNVAPVVAASHLNYRRPISWPADVLVELFVERLGGSSLTMGHRIVDSGDGDTVYCDGNVVMVWIDRTSGRAAPLPDAVRSACA